MGEREAIENAPLPRTRESLARDLRELGVTAGMTLLMHSSLSSLGWVAGGPVAVVAALIDVVTEAGTIVVPTFSSDLSDPVRWHHPPVPESWWPVIYASMPAFDPRTTPTRQMGKIVDTFRTWPGAVRSNHPADSFAAWGRHAEFITAGHSLESGLGEGSPLARLYDLDGWVLLLGVGFGYNTSFHLAEYRNPEAPQTLQGAPVFENGHRVCKSYRDVEIDDSPFPEIGAAFEQAGKVRLGRVGSAEARLFRQRPAVDFALRWLTRNKREVESQK
jgi:aminoglycoside 3-N-acetyltransferase